MQQDPGKKLLQDYALQSLQQLQQACRGLSSRQGEQRRSRRNGTGEPLSRRIRRAFVSPFSVVLLVLVCISLLADVLLPEPSERNYTTVSIITLMLAVSGCIRLVQELRAKRAADRLLPLMDAPVSVKRDGRWTACEVGNLVPGDYVRILAGERVPADIRLIRLKGCFLSEAGITGESGTVTKSVGPLEQLPETLGDYRNIAFCGSTVLSGSLEGIVIALESDSLYGRPVPRSADRKLGFDRGANEIAWVLIRFMALLVPIVFLAGGLTQGSWFSAFLFSLSVAVGLTPELLPMVITACLAKGSLTMRRKQTLVRNVNAMQGFGSMDVLCVDKTGTLTEADLTLEYYTDVLGNEDDEVLDLAYLNSFFQSGIRSPLDTAILKTETMPGRQAHYSALVRGYRKLRELPFDHDRRCASLLAEGTSGSLMITKGDPDRVLARCRYVWYRGRRLEIGAEAERSLHAVIDEMLEDGIKVLAVATGEGTEERDLTLRGYLAFLDPPRKTAAGAISRLRDLQVATKVLTGDHLQAAVSVCRRLGLDPEKCMTGRELEGLSDNQIQVRVEDTQIFAELTPAQKAQILSVLQSSGHTVGFLADGMNDLSAVQQADVGICVDSAAPAVRECADVILLKQDLGVLQSGITEGRRAFANMSKYVKITASSNLGNIIAIVIASLFLPFFPMTSVQLLLLNLLYDILCLVLPWDRVDPELSQKPLEWSGKTLSRFMLTFGPISSVFDILTFAFLYFFLCPGVCGGPFHSLPQPVQLQFISLFQTGWFLESMWTQVLILHLLRTERLPFVRSNASGPVWAVTWIGVIAFTLLAVTPVGGLIGMTGLPPLYYLFLTVTVCAYLFAVNLVKQVCRRRWHHLL